MSVRTDYPNILAEAAEALGIEVFQQVVAVELDGEGFDEKSLVTINELTHLEKLVVTGEANISDCNLARFSERRPEVEVVVQATKSQEQSLVPLLASDVPAKRPITMFVCPSSTLDR